MSNYEEIDHGNGKIERIHLGSDGRPNGRREFINNNNWKTRAEMKAFDEAVYGPTRNTCTCGGNYEPFEKTTRASNNFFGIGRKGTMRGRRCSDCGRQEV